MGMAASQGRLLFMTARLSNNEFEQQCVAYSKQRLAETSQTANDAYLDALNATSYQVLTGYNGTEATFENVTYNQLTGFNNVAAGKQYIVQDNTGKILVSSTIANAFKNGNGDYNKFLKELGLTQVNIDVTDKTASLTAIHEAWDKYLVSVGKGLNSSKTSTGDEANSRHILGFGYNTLDVLSTNGEKATDILAGYPLYRTAFAKSFAGNTYDISKVEDGKYYTSNYPVSIEQDVNDPTKYVPVYKDAIGAKHVLTDYAVITDGITDPTQYVSFTDKDGHEYNVNEVFVKPFTIGNGEISYKAVLTTEENTELDPSIFNISAQDTALNYEGTTAAQRRLYDYAVAITEAYYNQEAHLDAAGNSVLEYDANKISYYQNIYNMMLSKGYTTYENMKETKYISSTARENEALKDDQWLITQLKSGKLTIAYFSAVQRDFIKSSLDDDESITEKEDKSKIAIAEQVYNSTMDRIESQDKYFDMQLNKLEAEHSALQTEYESVAKVISKNVEKSFNTFSA